MQKILTISLLVVAVVLSSCTKEQDSSSFFMPGEFETHEAVWLGWEGEDTTYHPVVYNMIRAMMPKVPVKIAISSDSLMAVVKTRLSKVGIDTNAIQFFKMPGERYWIRDHGAAFLVNKEGGLSAVDFDWSLYGYFDWWKLREPELADTIALWARRTLTGKTSRVDSLMAVSTEAKLYKSTLVMEGGALESNGKGVLIQNEQVSLQRNPGWTKEQIEQEYKRLMNVKKVIWLTKGLADDEHIWHLHDNKYVTMGTGGHTDEFVRFANAQTILLAWIDESEKDLHYMNQVTYARMQENLKILEAATDQDGKPFRIIKVPLPNPVEWTVEVAEKRAEQDLFTMSPKSFLPSERPAVGTKLTRVAASSYLNFIVTNGLVINASYTTHGTTSATEAKVKAIFKEVFPDREQVWIDALPLNRNGGGIHCSTQQEPKRITEK